MRYALIHAADEDVVPDADRDGETGVPLSSWLEEAIRTGANLHGSRLRPGADATTVRVRGGEVIVTDGPFAETKEQIGGYDVLECADLDEAVRWAGRHPSARAGAIEVRALPEWAPAAPLPAPGEGRIRYMMLACADPATDSGDSARAAAGVPWDEGTGGRSACLFCTPLEAPDGARTVRVRQGGTVVTEGPFGATTEQIAGFGVLECADLDEAIEVAGRHPVARVGIMEVRPFWPIEMD